MESNRMHITIRPMRKPKRFRSAFTTEQIMFLELQFKKFPYISSEHRKEIASSLNMQERAVKIWFQNRRMKEKKETTNKELDFISIHKKEDGKDRLNNAGTLPSANEQLSYSFPIIGKPVDSPKSFAKMNTDTTHRGIRDVAKAQRVPQNLSMNHIKPSIKTNGDLNIKYQVPYLNVDFKHRNSLPRKQFKCKNHPIHKKSAEFSIDVNKKIKKTDKDINLNVNLDQKSKLQNRFEQPSVCVKTKTTPGDLSSNKKATVPQMPSRPPKPVAVNGPSYVPVMSTTYAHPYMSSGGVLWKPINIMPIVAQGSAIPFQNNLQPRFGYDQKNNCNCNCHENPQQFTVPTSSISPYAQYVMTAPAAYPSSSHKI